MKPTCKFLGVVLLLVTSAWGESRVPAWNQRGVGLLPWQGVAALEAAPDGSQIVVGTIAPAGDPNVIVISGEGRVLRELAVGQRWIGQVALSGGGALHALCTTPAGKASDGPTVFSCGEMATAIPNTLGESAYPRTIFFYGDHSNHSGVQLAAARDGNVALYGNQVLWLGEPGAAPRATAQVPWPAEGVATAFAAHSSGAVVAGFSALAGNEPLEANLFLILPGDKQPRWKRPAVMGAEIPPLEKGRYGTPTLRDGTRAELPQRDLAAAAPLSLAVSPGGELRRIAAADYRGWQRWIRSSATMREQNYGTRFLPAAPTVTVYDAGGEVVRRFGPETFGQAGWVDLAFLPGDQKLLVFPHHWASRGLAGQPCLPADDDARKIWLLDVETGVIQSREFPDAVASAAIDDAGRIAVGCWDGRLYLLSADNFSRGNLPEGVALGGPALVRPRGKEGWVAGTAAGVVHLLNREGKSLHTVDLNQAIARRVKPWVTNAKAEKINDGLWQLPGGRVESDLGGQRVIEGPDGLILIEGHAGLSFEREWHALEAAGLDPRRVKFVLATHEHGDHAPGAYLWRVTTGAQFVCSEEMAYTLQHHLPLSTGYGLHPPVPTDRRIQADEDLDLAGVKVRALRLSGHTFGSMGWLVERGGKKYVAIGDLIMPDGVLGYAGSVNFSATDVLASLRKLETAQVDFILPGHGPITSPERYVAAGIGVGRHVGWGKMWPEAPDPRYRLAQENVLVAAWNLDQTSADFGDLNGDGRPDIAVAVPEGSGASVKIFLNQGGKFAERPAAELRVPSVAEPNKVRVRELNGDGRLDLFVGGRASALLLSQGDFPKFETTAVGVGDGNQARRVDLEGAEKAIAVNARFGAFARVGPSKEGIAQTSELAPKITGPYLDLWSGDLNGDGRPDRVYSYGQVFLRQDDGKLPAEPSLRLPATQGSDWSYFAVGDFNADRRLDLAFFSMPQEVPQAKVFHHTGRADAPYRLEPDATLDLADPPGEKKNQHPLLRDSVVAADWNGDGATDLVIGKGQGKMVTILPGGPRGLDPARAERITLNFRIHYETGLFVGDFNGDGKSDLACLGDTNTGVGAGGPPAVYIYLR